MKLVGLSSISVHYDKEKQAVILFVVSDESILVQGNMHQGGMTYDIFGTPASGLPPFERIMADQHTQFGTSYPVIEIGTMITYINKSDSDGRVRLSAKAFLLELTQEQKLQLRIRQNQLWLDRATVLTTPYIREDDKYYISRVLDGKELNIVIDVDQPGKWIDAKLLAVAEY